MNVPGKTSSHQYDLIGLINVAASDTSVPQLASGAGTPTPRKLMNDSSSITAGTVSVR